MMRKLVVRFLMLLFVLGMSMNAAWAIDVSTAKIYVASMQAQSSTAAECTGAGQVQLTWIDIKGNAIANPQFVGTGKLNETNPVGPAATALMTGGTLSAMDGIEVSAAEIIGGSQIYMTSFVYFKADAIGENGSYFHEWTFNDPSITRQDTAMDKTQPESAYFKLLPDTVNNGVVGSDKFNNAVAYVMTHPNNIYAVFKKYLLSNPVVVNNGTATAEAGSSATINVSVDVEGDMSQLKALYADFDLPATKFAEDEEGEWTWALGATPAEVLTPMKGRANLVITYTAKEGIEAGTKRATFVAKMQGTNPSTINIPLAVEVRPESIKEASVKIGNADPVEYENLAGAVTAANAASGDVTLTLLRDVSDAITLSKTMKLDLNSYTLSNNLVIASGNVELVYNKQGGKITKTVAVQSGATLTLNGGTIEVSGVGNPLNPSGAVVAVNVANGGKLIQNGATISATALTCYAIGINVDGEAEVKDGSITAHAGMTAAFAAQVSATGKLTTTGGVFNASVDQTHTPTADPADQSTWSNAYAVYVTAPAGEANIQGGTFYSTSSYSGAFAVSALASFGKLTIGKNAVVSAHTVSSDPVSYAVGCMGSANLTVNGGRFSATYSNQAKACPPFLCAAFANLEFKSGIIKADSVYVRADMFPSTMTLVQPKLYNVVKNGKDYNDGYRYIAVADPATQADLIAAGVPAARIGTTGYTKLEDAIAYANNNPTEELVIFMQNNYTLPAGYYTLPAKATLVIPMSDDQAKEINTFPPRVSFHDLDRSHPYEEPTEFRRLTFANGVNLDVFGAIEMTCTQFASNEAYTAQPYGPYGHLVMEEGSHITLQANSELRAWGFMTGKGETDARRDATVREMFQLGDWKGAMTSVQITGMAAEAGVADHSDKKIFPVSQYFIQNVEAPVKYHPGAVLSTAATVGEGFFDVLAITMSASDIKVVGVDGRDAAIFLLDKGADADNTWVRKWYDAENDIQVYDINSAAHIGSMVLDMGELDVSFLMSGVVLPVRLNSAKFDLPITSNMKIHLLSGTLNFQQNTSLLPGSEVEVDKESIVSVAKDNNDTEHTGALYVYDADDWHKYAFCRVAEYDKELKKWVEKDDSAYTKTVRYSPSWSGQPTKRNEQVCPPDAAINVHGMFNTDEGFVYTSENGANIFSSNEDAGTYVFNQDAKEAGTRTVNNVIGESEFEELTFYPAKLRNGDGTYKESFTDDGDDENDAHVGDAYCYIDDEWKTMYQDEDDFCFMVKPNANGDKYFAKPAGYVEINATKKDGVFYGNTDHTYSDAAGEGHLFILTGNCQWWEVEKKDNLYHCIHPDNDTYYYWQEDEPDPSDPGSTIPAHWAEKTYTITWKNWNGDIIQTVGKVEESYQPVDSYEVAYGTMAEFLGTNPTREKDADSTYNFTGWKPALGPVTQDVTYTATYESKPRMYTIIFQNEGETEIERQFLTHNAVPVCENTPTKVGHTLVWSPAISPVIGDQTYIATWLENPPTEWDVTFVNNANGVLQATEAVGVNDHPAYSGSTPAKENADHTAYSSNEYTYTFWGWSAVIDGVAQQFEKDATLPCPTAPTTYTAVYTEAQKTYVVRFMDEEGTLIPGQEYNLPYGAMPVCSATPTKANTAEWTYGFAWDPQIQTVMASEDPVEYRATFPATKNRYTITLTSNLSGVCTFTGAGTFDYGTTIDNVVVSYNDSKYTFTGWSDSEENAAHPSFKLTGDVTLTANFTPIALSDHTIATGEAWEVDEDTEVKDLILTSDGSACGQLLNPENLTIRGEAIFRMDQDFAAGQWYAVAVPWRVNPATGIYGASGRLASGSQIYIIEFDGAAYAQVGGTEDTYQYWHFLHETGADMIPGKLYMIYLTSGQSKLDFHKKAGAALQTRNLTVSAASGSAGASFANWNAIANPALYTADLSTGVTAYQTYNNDEYQNYTVVETATSGLIVAKPIFVQVATPSTVYATIPSASLAPYRRVQKAETDAKFVVEINRNNKMADRLIIETADEKEDKYVIGQDLAKFGVSSKVAQMWINRYDAKLCKNTVEFDGERADYPLNIFAPAAGEYTLHLTPYTSGSDYALYLTLNGEAIWNLSDAAYTLTLQKGNTAEYGLRISVRKAPEVVTGMDEAVVEAQGDIRKVLINNQVFIIRGEKVYTIDGQMVK